MPGAVGAAPRGDVRPAEGREHAFSIGAWLAAQRRLRGLSLEEVEAATRIQRRALERLEAGAFDGQQDAFTRSFVRTVSDAIGLDPSDALVRLHETAVRTPEPWRRPARSAGSLSGLAMALGLAAAALLAGFALSQLRLPDLGAWLTGPAPELRVRRDFVTDLAHAVARIPPPEVDESLAFSLWQAPPPGIRPWDPFAGTELVPPQAPPDGALRAHASARAARRAWLRRLGASPPTPSLAGPAEPARPRHPAS